MSDESIKRLKEQRAAVWSNMRDVLQVAETEKRSMTGEELTKFKGLEAELKSQGEEIEARERTAAIATVFAAPAPTLGVPSGEPRTATDGPEAEHAAAEARAFWQYMRSGRLDHEARDVLEARSVERRDMGVASGAAGGYLVPPGFLAKITEVQKWFGGVRKVANVIETTTGQSLIWPSNDDTGNPAVIIGEDTQVSELDLSFGQKTLSAYMWTTGAVRIGRALMQDTAFDLESVVADRFGKRFGRGQNTAFTTGAGISGGIAGGTVGTVNGGVLVLTYAQLVAHVHKIDPAYRASPNCGWMMSDSTLSAIQQITDTAGRPLFVPAGSFGSIALAAGGPVGSNPGGSADTLLGYPITINNDLAAPAASGSAVIALFGDFHAGYIVRDVTDSTATLRLDERYADYAEVGFIGYMRSDGTRDDPNALSAIANHA